MIDDTIATQHVGSWNSGSALLRGSFTHQSKQSMVHVLRPSSQPQLLSCTATLFCTSPPFLYFASFLVPHLLSHALLPSVYLTSFIVLHLFSTLPLYLSPSCEFGWPSFSTGCFHGFQRYVWIIPYKGNFQTWEEAESLISAPSRLLTPSISSTLSILYFVSLQRGHLHPTLLPSNL